MTEDKSIKIPDPPKIRGLPGIVDLPILGGIDMKSVGIGIIIGVLLLYAFNKFNKKK